MRSHRVWFRVFAVLLLLSIGLSAHASPECGALLADSASQTNTESYLRLLHFLTFEKRVLRGGMLDEVVRSPTFVSPLEVGQLALTPEEMHTFGNLLKHIDPSQVDWQKVRAGAGQIKAKLDRSLGIRNEISEATSFAMSPILLRKLPGSTGGDLIYFQASSGAVFILQGIFLPRRGPSLHYRLFNTGSSDFVQIGPPRETRFLQMGIFERQSGQIVVYGRTSRELLIFDGTTGKQISRTPGAAEVELLTESEAGVLGAVFSEMEGSFKQTFLRKDLKKAVIEELPNENKLRLFQTRGKELLGYGIRQANVIVKDLLNPRSILEVQGLFPVSAQAVDHPPQIQLFEDRGGALYVQTAKQNGTEIIRIQNQNEAQRHFIAAPLSADPHFELLQPFQASSGEIYFGAMFNWQDEKKLVIWSSEKGRLPDVDLTLQESFERFVELKDGEILLSTLEYRGVKGGSKICWFHLPTRQPAQCLELELDEKLAGSYLQKDLSIRYLIEEASSHRSIQIYGPVQRPEGENP